MSDVYGPDNRPVPEGPNQHIFEFHQGGASPYVIAKFRIWRRVYSAYARAYNEWYAAGAVGGAPAPGDPDLVEQSLISYVSTFEWPIDAQTAAPASPPFDVAPNQALISPESGSINGMPTLPGVSGFGSGVPSKGAPGKHGTTQIQSAGFEPCLRLVNSPGGTPPSAGVVPEPPGEGGEVATWGSTQIMIQLHDGGLISASDPGPQGGATLAETSVGFSGLVYTDTNGRTYQAIQGAVRPRDWSAYSRDQSGGIYSIKGSNFGEVWILMQRRR